jgi:hypothetical protein
MMLFFVESGECGYERAKDSLKRVRPDLIAVGNSGADLHQFVKYYVYVAHALLRHTFHSGLGGFNGQARARTAYQPMMGSKFLASPKQAFLD